MKKVNVIFLGLISIYGLFTCVKGLFEFIDFNQKWQAVLISACFFVVSPWFVRLPSGSMWRPAISLVMLSMLLFPSSLTVLIAAPGLFLFTWKNKAKWWDYPLTIGHIGVGVAISRQVFLSLSPLNFSLPLSILGIFCALLVHLIINRFIAVVIVTTKKNKRFRDQFHLTLKELHWGYFTTYFMSILMYMQTMAYGFWGLAICFIFLIGIYESFVYYNRMRFFQQSANTDGLTGCENRSAFETFISSSKQTNLPCIIIMMDLDRFKVLNDECGHLVGDEVLRQFSGAMFQKLKSGDHFFRYGGDEFILYIANETELNLRYLRAIKDLEQQWSERGYPVRVSYGQAVYPIDGASWKELIHIADERMYDFKRKQKLRA